MKTFKQFLEEDGEGAGIASGAPTNTVGSGAIAGVGVGPKGEPGVLPKRNKRNPVLTAAPITRKI
jgi:hypothetical protein